MAEFSYISNTNTRTAGRTGRNSGQYKTVQAWRSRKTAPQQEIISQKALLPSKAPQKVQNQILANLEKAADGKVGTFDVEMETSLAYANAGRNVGSSSKTQTDEGFQFYDVVDVINPLQHLPVISMVYRGITGDKLHPMSQIIGGALYGGPVGAVVGTANAISQVQTGKDIGEQVLGFVGIENEGASSNPAIDKNNPEAQLNNVADTIDRQAPLEDLPGSTLSFVNLSEPNKGYKRVNMADGRTAGSMIVKKQMASYHQSINTAPLLAQESKEAIPKTNFDNLPAREEITSIKISAMPPKQDV